MKRSEKIHLNAKHVKLENREFSKGQRNRTVLSCGKTVPIPCCHLHEAGMNSLQHSALRLSTYMETSAAY